AATHACPAASKTSHGKRAGPEASTPPSPPPPLARPPEPPLESPVPPPVVTPPVVSPVATPPVVLPVATPPVVSPVATPPVVSPAAPPPEPLPALGPSAAVTVSPPHATVNGMLSAPKTFLGFMVDPASMAARTSATCPCNLALDDAERQRRARSRRDHPLRNRNHKACSHQRMDWVWTEDSLGWSPRCPHS